MDESIIYTKQHIYHIICDIVLIAIFVGLFFYVFKNIEYVKMMGGDTCRMCMDLTNATCFKIQL